jgi:hypothetical protein
MRDAGVIRGFGSLAGDSTVVVLAMAFLFGPAILSAAEDWPQLKYDAQ